MYDELHACYYSSKSISTGTTVPKTQKDPAPAPTGRGRGQPGRADMRDDTASWVYFIEAIGVDAIKIGVASNLFGRLAQLQTGSPFELMVRATVYGDEDVEKYYHRRFASQLIRGEWFTYSGPINNYLRRRIDYPLARATVETGGICVYPCATPAVHDDVFCTKHAPRDWMPDLPWHNDDPEVVRRKAEVALQQKSVRHRDSDHLRNVQWAKTLAEQRRWHRERRAG